MTNISHFEPVVAILTSVVVCAAWWFATLKRPQIRLFPALAVLTTVRTAIDAVLFYQIELQQRLTYYHALSRAQTSLGILEAALYVVLILWLVRTLTKDPHP
jgi:hypothetical protein